MSHSTNLLSALLAAVLLATSSLAAVATEPEEAAASIFASAPNVLTTEQLDSLDFRVRFHPSQVEKEEDVRDRLIGRPDDVQLLAKASQLKQTRKWLEKLPLALYMTKAEYRLDEPVDAYFAIKNTTNEFLYPDMLLDLQLGKAAYNNCEVNLRRIDKMGVEQRLRLTEVTACGGPPKLVLPPKRYYCMRADLRRIGADKPGTYKMSWNYNPLLSQEVTFKVLPDKKAEADNRPIRDPRFIHLVQLETDRTAASQKKTMIAAEPFSPPVLRDVRLKQLRYNTVATALASTENGDLYPDVLDLPQQDQFIQAAIELTKPKEGKVPTTFVVTLTPRQENKGLFLGRADHIALLGVVIQGAAASVSDEEFERVPNLKIGEQEKITRVEGKYSLSDLKKPLRIEIELNENWPRHLMGGGTLELQAIISSDPLIPLKYLSNHETTQRTEPPFDARQWRGVLCTPSIRVEVPFLGELRPAESHD